MTIAQLDVLSFLKQFTPWQFKFPLSSDDYRWVVYPMRSALTAAAPTGQVTQKIPTTHTALIYKMSAFIRISDWSAESLAISNVGNPTVQDRIAAKVMNCKLDFKLSDVDYKVFDGAASLLSNLGQLHPLAGGSPIDMNPPLIVEGGKTLQLDTSLEDTETSIVGASTLYGVDVRALLVRKSAN